MEANPTRNHEVAVGEFLILAGTFTSKAASDLRWFAAAASFGVVLAAVYLLKMLAATLWGPIRHEENKTLLDLSLREKLLLAPLCAVMLWMGVAPDPFLAPSRAALADVLATYQTRSAEAPVATAAVRAVPAPASTAAFGMGVAPVLPAAEAVAPESEPPAAAASEEHR